VYQVGINKGIILWCTAYHISSRGKFFKNIFKCFKY